MKEHSGATGADRAFNAHFHSTSTDCTNRASWAPGGETRLSTSGSFDDAAAPNAGGFFRADGLSEYEVTAAWVVAQDLMAAYANPDRVAGKAAAEQLITTAHTRPVPEITRLGRTLTAWRAEFLARIDHPGVSNGPTECLNLKVNNTKRAARGDRSFTNYRLRLLLNHGLIRDDQVTTRIRTRRPSFVA